jgi:hypothetical protein
MNDRLHDDLRARATGRLPDLAPVRAMLGAPARAFVEHLEDLVRRINP